MRTLLGLFLLMIVASVACCQATPATQRPFSLTLSTPTANVESGSVVQIMIAMKNLSDHDVDCTPNETNRLDTAFEYDVRDGDGKPVESWEKKHPEVGQVFSPRMPRSLKPGETINTGEVISSHYNMTQPGEYTIQVSRRISNDAKDGVVKSNKITVTVVDSTPKAPPPPQTQR